MFRGYTESRRRVLRISVQAVVHLPNRCRIDSPASTAFQSETAETPDDYRWKKKLFSEQGRAQLEKLSLAPWASRRRQELLELLDRMNPTIEELSRSKDYERAVVVDAGKRRKPKRTKEKNSFR